jgi:ribonuclease BN (tRNA processing enzyme)
MFLEVLGADGGKHAGSHLVSMRLGPSVLLDAGSAANLRPDELRSIETVLLTHAHLDHILELGFIADATAGFRNTPLRVLGSPACLQAVRTHYMNDLVWPDFSRIRTSSGPAIVYEELVDREWFDLPGGVRAIAVPVNHGAGARGFLFRAPTGSLLYTGDTGPTQEIWERGAELEDLGSIVSEVSFPDSKQDLAIASDHLTPSLLETELRGMPRSVPVYVFHLKPWYRQEIDRDLSRQLGDRAVLLMRGDRLEF